MATCFDFTENADACIDSSGTKAPAVLIGGEKVSPTAFFTFL